MIVLVTGGRDFKRYGDVAAALDVLDVVEPINLVMQGGCPTGADKHARDWATLRERDCLTIPAKWKTTKPVGAAGPIRNQRMADKPYGIVPDYCIAFPGGKGTADMMAKARLAGIAVKEIR